MDKWEYRIELVFHRGGEEQTKEKPFKYLWELDLEEQLNDFGKEGWEIVEFSSPDVHCNKSVMGTVVLKRKKVDPNESLLKRVLEDLRRENDVDLLQEIEDAKNDPRFANTDESRARFLAVLEEIYGIEGDTNGESDVEG